MRDGNPHQEDMRAAEKTIKGTAYAAAAFALLYVPCILAALLLPSPPTTSEKFSRTLTFNVMEDGTETMIAFGTPPKVR